MHHFRCSIVVNISACHAEDPGSIPGGGVVFPFCLLENNVANMRKHGCEVELWCSSRRSRKIMFAKSCCWVQEIICSEGTEDRRVVGFVFAARAKLEKKTSNELSMCLGLTIGSQ